MMLKKSDLQDLKKQGVKAIDSKLNELRIELASSTLKATRGEIKNLRSAKAIRRSIAQLKTIKGQLQLKADQPMTDKSQATKPEVKKENN